jgi:hypothetical protein
MFYCELLSGIWIGDTDILLKDQFISDNNIKLIINCTKIFDFPKIKDVKKIRIPFSEYKESNDDIFLLRENKDKLLSIIKDNIDNNILICCYNGKSISPFIVSLFIDKYSKLDHTSIYPILLSKNKELESWCDISIFSS